tara:strand:- start:2077 stop:3168 length:1092 start_codon:yes stop_codon:yes gene_type:complete
MWTFLLALAFALPISIVVLLGIGAFIYLHPDQAKKWGAILGSWITYFYEKFDYITIKWETEGRLNTFVKNLESNMIRTFPTVRLQWATSQDKEEVLWEEGKAILVMRDRKHKGRNFVHAAYLFTSKSLLQNTSFHISKKQKGSLELFATKKILEDVYKGLVQQFMSDYFSPKVQSDDDLKQLITKYIAIERIGAFFPILIQEIHCLGNKVFLEEARKEETISEVKELLDFLVEFSERRVGDTAVPNTFVGNFTRCAIRVVASKAVRERGEVDGHKSDIVDLVKRSLENIYVIGSDHPENREFVDSVVNAVLEEETQLQLRKTYRFKGKIKVEDKWKNTDTYLVHLHNPDAEEYLFTKDKLDSE